VRLIVGSIPGRI